MIKRAPFILEIRDIWPESVIATGVLSRNPLVLFLEWLEVFLYRRARHIVVVTDSFVEYLRGKGIPGEKITVIKNGFDLEKMSAAPEEELVERVREEHDLQNRFVVSYIGTLGRAHKVELLWEAAERIDDPDVVFMVVGTGPERRTLERLQHNRPLPNFRLVDKQPHERVLAFYEASDLVVVHLRDFALFRTVIPSKIFECMALGRPILLGVRGESEALVHEAGAGITFSPEDADALIDAVRKLKADPGLRRRMASAGQVWVALHHDRRVLARRWLDLLRGLSRVDSDQRSAPEAERMDPAIP
jgi:glycosyltransferase involved in cell wall biosynthesis